MVAEERQATSGMEQRIGHISISSNPEYEMPVQVDLSKIRGVDSDIPIFHTSYIGVIKDCFMAQIRRIYRGLRN